VYVFISILHVIGRHSTRCTVLTVRWGICKRSGDNITIRSVRGDTEKINMTRQWWERGWSILEERTCETTWARPETGQALSPPPCESLANLKSGMSGPWIACTGGAVEVSAVVTRFIEYGRPRSEDGERVLECDNGDASTKVKPTRHNINNAARIVGWVKRVYTCINVTWGV